jgi:hypothetical protein
MTAKVMSVLLVAALLLVALAVPIYAVGSQVWYFTGDDITIPPYVQANGPTTHAGDKIMTKGVHATYAGNVVIGNGGGAANEAWWYADEDATTGMGFGEEKWYQVTWVYDCVIPGGTATDTGILRTTVVNVHTDGSTTDLATSDLVVVEGMGGVIWGDVPDIGATTQDFVAGDRVAVRVELLTGHPPGTDSIAIHYGAGCSQISSPTTDPGYPQPELATVVLLGTGLACLAGYMGVRRYRASHLG